MHRPVSVVGAWLKKALTGYYAYYSGEVAGHVTAGRRDGGDAAAIKGSPSTDRHAGA